MGQREGYLFVDHSASPGIPEEVALSIGLDPQLVREGKVLEAATKTCVHCKSAVMINPLRTRERASCMKCGGKYICDDCALQARLSGYSHTPFEKRVDLAKDAEAKGIPILGSPPALLQPPMKG